jgi:uncharacterized protein YeaO (DUF488 family)
MWQGDIVVVYVKRVYDVPKSNDGYRVLVERLWPRGISKEKARVDLWLKDAGASPGLRQWFSHDPAKWETFRLKYFEEMDQKPHIVKQLLDLIRTGHVVTLVFSARDLTHNNAVALKEYIEREASTGDQ